MLPPTELLNFLKKEEKFVIATHMSPDGDGLGSAIALSMALQKIGKETILLCRDSVPQQCKFMPGHERFHNFDTLQLSAVSHQSFKNLILVDCNDIDRISTEVSQISNLKFQISAVIDHHESEKPFGDIRWVTPEAAATGLMVFHIIKELGVEMTEEMVINLYAAISVDTGNFRYENTTHEVFSVAAELKKAGARTHAIYRELFESWSEGRFNLFMKVLNTLEMKDGIAFVRVTKKMFEETATFPDDTEHFVDFPRIMKDIKVSILFREIENDYYKLSLRSKDDINVAHVAEEFGGGGHKNAAGCRIRADFETAKREVLKAFHTIPRAL